MIVFILDSSVCKGFPLPPSPRENQPLPQCGSHLPPAPLGASGAQRAAVLYLLLLAVRGLGDEADVDLFHVRAARASGGDADGVGRVSAAQVRPTLQLVKGLGMGAAAGAGLCAGGLPAGTNTKSTIRSLPFLVRAHQSLRPDSTALKRFLQRLGTATLANVAQLILKPRRTFGERIPVPGHSLAPALNDARVLLRFQSVAGRFRQGLNLTGEAIARKGGKEKFSILVAKLQVGPADLLQLLLTPKNSSTREQQLWRTDSIV